MHIGDFILEETALAVDVISAFLSEEHLDPQNYMSLMLIYQLQALDLYPR